MKAIDVARYYLLRAFNDGDFITNLKMQKLVYYAYVWTLVNTSGQKLFSDPIEAWPNGPVIPSLYHELKQFGSMPIDESFLQNTDDSISTVESSDLKEYIDNSYETYVQKSAFELVNLTHSEGPWLKSRGDKSHTDTNSEAIKDSDILEFYMA